MLLFFLSFFPSLYVVDSADDDGDDDMFFAADDDLMWVFSRMLCKYEGNNIVLAGTGEDFEELRSQLRGQPFCFSLNVT